MILKKLCLFSSFSEKRIIDNNIKYYLLELRSHFDEMYFLTNLRILDDDSIQFLRNNNIKLQQVPNNGLDFGMYWNVIKDLNVNKYESIALVNDSCYLFKSLTHFFNWYNESDLDIAGFTDSYEINYHIQSYFLIYSKKVLNHLKTYFMEYGIINDRNLLIRIYEVGFCKYIADLGSEFKLGSMYPNTIENNLNRTVLDIPALLAEGIPLIKRKAILKSYSYSDAKHIEALGYDFNINYRTLLDIDDETIRELIPINTVVYQIYYDDSQKSALSSDTIPYFNDKLTPYFENIIIREIYNRSIGEYFGVLSWKFSEKNLLDFNEEYIDGEYDIYAFNPFYDEVRKASAKCHPFFGDIFDAVMRNLNIDPNINIEIGLYTNSVITRSHIYKKYVTEYLIPTMNFLDNLDESNIEQRRLRKKLWSNSKYITTTNNPFLPQKLKDNIGRPYYTYHPFICERLWSLFYEVHKNIYTMKVINYWEINKH